MSEEKKRNQETATGQRERYMDRKISHDEYYLWLSEFVGIKCPAFLIEAAKKSKDKHLNDVALIIWDRQHPWVSTRASSKGIAWSLSDTVCCLKTLAKKERDNEQNNQSGSQDTTDNRPREQAPEDISPAT